MSEGEFGVFSTDSCVVVLVATWPRTDLLCRRSLPTIANQTYRPEAIVIVSDRQDLTVVEKENVLAVLDEQPVFFLRNTGEPGVSDTWNTGIDFIKRHWPTAYVAILDDDDQWCSEHLLSCVTVATKQDYPDVVLSGIQMLLNGMRLESCPLETVCVEDFLHTNPGWQGSNTFVKVMTLVRAGKFRRDLVSTNDRDLAIRLLDLPDITVGFTGKKTVTWHGGERQDALSQPGSQKKLMGLAMFYNLYAHRMNPNVREMFFHRCLNVFGFSERQIMENCHNGADLSSF